MKMIKLDDSSQLPENYTGKVIYERLNHVGFYKNGVLHNLDGPAGIINESSYRHRYYINGHEYNISEYEIAAKQHKLLENLMLIKNIDYNIFAGKNKKECK